MSDEPERQLEAFGATLESSTAEPIRASDHGRADPVRSGNRPWAMVGAAACLLAVVVGLVVVTGRNAEAPTAQPPAPTSNETAPLVGGGGLGAFEPLVGVGAVVEATVIGFRGPRAVEISDGVLDYRGSSEDAEEWTTPLDAPVIVLSDLELVTSIGGSERADSVANDVEEAIEASSDVEVVVPVGIYREGMRYELWLGPQQDLGYMAYLAFDGSGATIDGLLIQEADATYARLAEHTGEGRVESLAAIARELNAAWDGGGGQGALMDFVFGPEETTSEEQTSEFYEGTADGTVDDDGRVDVDVTVFGAEPDVTYGLRGTRLLGWFTAGADGHLGLVGQVPAGEELQLVTEHRPDGGVDVVAGVPVLVVASEGDPREFRAFTDLDDNPIVWQAGLSLGELNTLIRSALGLPPEVVHDDPLALERDGWTLVQRTTEPFSAGEIPCATAQGLADFDGAASVHDILTPPEGTGLDVDLQVLDVGSIERGNRLAEVLAMIGRCAAESQGVEGEAGGLSSVRASWFRAGPDFALVTVVGDGSRSIVFEIEGAPFDDDLIGELAHRADQFLRGAPIGSEFTSDDDPAETERPEIPQRPMTAVEELRFDDDDDTGGLVCDERGRGGANWDWEPVGPDDVENREPVDEFWAAIDDNVREMQREGGVPYPTDGWTELVGRGGISLFVLEVEGEAKATITVTGDPKSGVWRRAESAACQSLFIP